MKPTHSVFVALLALFIVVESRKRVFDGIESWDDKELSYTVELANMIMGGLVMQTFCGGALINKRYVLTAAHCFEDNTNPENMVVIAGEHDLTQIRKTYQVNRIIIHPKWSSKSLFNDIALLELDEDVAESDTVKYIKLADSLPDVGTELNIAGWGRTTDFASPLVLRRTKLVLQADRSCSTVYSTWSNKVQICAGGKGHNPCKGDSGTSLTFEKDGDFYTLGVVSFGSGKCDGDIPATFTKVPTFIPWIGSNTPLVNKVEVQYNSTVYVRASMNGAVAYWRGLAAILAIIAVYLAV
jgi:secreted trypsin-like serine protease